jgi:predicted HNH restriction endonuclease
LSSYDMTSLVSEVNDRNNIAVLCPNCHWELDNGLLYL